MAKTPEDDWFPRAEASLSPDDTRQGVEDEWLADAPPAREAPFDPWSLADRRVLVPAGIAVAFLLGLLGAFGAFGNGPSPLTTVPIGTLLTGTAPAGTTTQQSQPQTTTQTPRAPTLVPPTTTLKPGDSGAQVKALQRELKSLGFAVGAVDGVYGKATVAAVTAFQRAHNLTADGIVGPATLSALAP